VSVRAVLFDLFDTLVRFDRTLLPTVTIGGRTVNSTAGMLHAVLSAYAPDVTVEMLYAALVESWQEAERRRAIDHREVAARDRFAHLLRCLALEPAACPSALMRELIETHRRGIATAARFPAAHAPLLRDLTARYRLAVVSNFDYTPTALEILETAGIAGLFDAIVVSDEIGWRKPAPAIFRVALERLGVGPPDALFVGDRADIDVAGARGIGMPVAWLNPAREPLPAGVPAPDYEIRGLDELRGILKVPGAVSRAASAASKQPAEDT
jgi:FMN phosphatase YigB (HAD superfamily)